MKINSFKKFSCIVLSTLITTSLLLSHLAGIIPDAVNIVHADETHDHSTWDAWGDEDDETTPMPNEAGSYYLIGNVELTETWTVPDGTINLCLNGYSIKAMGDFCTITVNNYSILNIYDESENNGKITHAENAMGCGVEVNGGELTLYGGNVSGNTNDDGGGVYVFGGSLTISGGNISGNKADLLGGGVYIGSASLTIFSGTISNNEAGDSGGGVFCAYSLFRMNGGSISENTCSDGDGGGLCFSISPITISGGDISGNTTLNGNGGGIYTSTHTTNNGDLTISGGTIKNNKAISKEDGVAGYGGGIYIEDGSFYMSGGTVKENDASSAGNNAYIGGYFEPSDKAVIEGGLVSNTYTTICYDSNCGTGEMTSKFIKKGDKVNLWLNGFEREDYLFSGWNTKYDGTGTAYADVAEVTVDSDEGLTLYAQWADGHKDHEEQDDEHGNCHDGWIAWTDEISLPSIPGCYYLTTDVTLNGEWDVPAGTTNLCLNGYRIVQSADGCDTIEIPGGATLNLYDVKDNSGVITHLKDDNGLIRGRGISVNYGTFNMYGGSISGNKITGHGSNGGGILDHYGVVTISGGKITQNETDWSGGGISAMSGKLTITDGEISDNVAHNDGGGVDVNVDDVTPIVISGGKIIGNKADHFGGGVTIWDGKPEISGGVISDNVASLGGGIYIHDDKQLTMRGGVISDNKAVVAESSRNSGFGGGICSKGKLTLNGGTVTDNTQESKALSTGYNVLIYPGNGTLVLAGGSAVNGGLYADGFSLVCLYSNEKNDGTDAATSQIVPANVEIKLFPNSFSRAGYDFTGWNTKADGSGTAYADEQKLKIASHDELKLYAQWAEHHKDHDEQDNETDGSHHKGWTAWKDDKNLPTTSGSYYLTTDVNLTDCWEVPQGATNLCLNGHNIARTNDGDVIRIQSGATLNLYDESDYSGTITHSKGNNNESLEGIGVYVDGTFNMYGGSISGNHTINCGGGVYIANGTLKFYDGAISNNIAQSGGGVYVETGTLTMTGGTITNNEANGKETNGAGYGDGVYCSGTYNLSGGTVTGNTASTAGLNIYIYGSGIFNPSGNVVIDGGLVSDTCTTICYDSNGGSGTMASELINKDENVILSKNSFTRKDSVFIGWNTEKDGTGDSYADEATVSVSADEGLTLYAQWVPDKYLITFVDDDGTVLQSKDVAYDTMPKYTGTKTPTKAPDAENTYIFAGWTDGTAEYGLTDNLPAAKEVKIYKPVFSSKINEYTITFKSDGKVISANDYPYGTVADDIVVPADPAIDPTAQYTYTFKGWSPSISNVTGDATYIAQFSTTVNQYTITFVDEDGTVLQKGLVDYGEIPEFKGTTPTKKATAQFTYTFSGWTSELSEVTGDATYTATYKYTVNEYTIKFINEDGTVLQTGKVLYGEMPVYNGSIPEKAADDKYTYIFSGWNCEITKATGDATYTAVFMKITKPISYYLKNFTGDGLGGDIVVVFGRSVDDANAISYLDRVETDGNVLTMNKEYTAESGSVIITLKKEYLDTLSEGTHKLTVYFKDGIFVTLDYTVKHVNNEAAGSVPSTGEMISKTLFIGGACVLLAVTLTGSMIVNKKKRKTEDA